MTKLLQALLAVCVLTTTLVGCGNTVQGVGKDMQDNGKQVEQAGR
jgi:predicted small secreted protein